MGIAVRGRVALASFVVLAVGAAGCCGSDCIKPPPCAPKKVEAKADAKPAPAPAPAPAK